VYQTFEVVFSAVPRQSLRARSKYEDAPGPPEAAVPEGAGAADAGWNWSTPHSSVSAAAAVSNTAGRLEGRFIVNLAVCAGVRAAHRPPRTVNDS
jgi:hypothetical protein